MKVKKNNLKYVGMILLTVLSLTACGKSVEERWQEQYDLGMKYLEELDYEQAIVAFTAAIEIEPNLTPAYIGRGDAYILSGETEEHLELAMTDYEKVLELDETVAEAYLGIADVYIRQGDYERALEILREGLEKTGNDSKIADKLNQMDSGNITDSENKIRRESCYDSAGALMWYVDYSYDPEGREDGVTSYDANGSRTGHVDVLYEGDNCIQSWGYDADAVYFALERVVFEYDAKGNITSEKWYDMEENATSSRTFEYDSEGKLLKETDDGTGGSDASYVLYEYSGNTVKRSYYDSLSGEMWGYDICEYDENGNLLKQSGYEQDGNLNDYWIYEYDETGKCVSETRYDGAGNVVSTMNSD